MLTLHISLLTTVLWIIYLSTDHIINIWKYKVNAVYEGYDPLGQSPMWVLVLVMLDVETNTRPTFVQMDVSTDVICGSV